VNLLSGLSTYTPASNTFTEEAMADESESAYGFVVTREMTMAFMHSECEFTRRKNALFRSAATLLVDNDNDNDNGDMVEKYLPAEIKALEKEDQQTALVEALYHCTRVVVNGECEPLLKHERPQDAVMLTQGHAPCKAQTVLYGGDASKIGAFLVEKVQTKNKNVQHFANIVGTEPVTPHNPSFKDTAISHPRDVYNACAMQVRDDTIKYCDDARQWRQILSRLNFAMPKNLNFEKDTSYVEYVTKGKIDGDLNTNLSSSNENLRKAARKRLTIARKAVLSTRAMSKNCERLTSTLMFDPEKMPSRFKNGLFDPTPIYDDVCRPSEREYDAVSNCKWLYLIPSTTDTAEQDCVVDFDNAAGWFAGDSPSHLLDAFSAVQCYVDSALRLSYGS
ncbi:MAG: hypothetical protein VW491_04815, partial [Gammaproteobacteria bacterium]